MRSALSIRDAVAVHQLRLTLGAFEDSLQDTRDLITNGIQSPDLAISSGNNLQNSVALNDCYTFRRNVRTIKPLASQQFDDRHGWRAAISPDNTDLQGADGINLTRSSCDLDCMCSCHKRVNMKSPCFLHMFLGTAFLGFQASPQSVQRCSHTLCRQESRQIHYNYNFPPWLLNRVLHVAMLYSGWEGPELCIRVVGVRPDYMYVIGIINGCSRGCVSIEVFKDMLRSREISALDMFPHQKSILTVSNPLVCIILATDIVIVCYAIWRSLCGRDTNPLWRRPLFGEY